MSESFPISKRTISPCHRSRRRKSAGHLCLILTFMLQVVFSLIFPSTGTSHSVQVMPDKNGRSIPERVYSHVAITFSLFKLQVNNVGHLPACLILEHEKFIPERVYPHAATTVRSGLTCLKSQPLSPMTEVRWSPVSDPHFPGRLPSQADVRPI